MTFNLKPNAVSVAFAFRHNLLSTLLRRQARALRVARLITTNLGVLEDDAIQRPILQGRNNLLPRVHASGLLHATIAQTDIPRVFVNTHIPIVAGIIQTGVYICYSPCVLGAGAWRAALPEVAVTRENCLRPCFLGIQP